MPDTEKLSNKELFEIFNTSPESAAKVFVEVLEVLKSRVSGKENIHRIASDKLFDWIARCVLAAINHCESPIEKAFICGILMRFLIERPQGIFVTAPMQDAVEDKKHLMNELNARVDLECRWDNYMSDVEEDLIHVPLEHKEDFLKEMEVPNSFDEYCRALVKQGSITPERADLILRDPVVSNAGLAWISFIISPQSVFKGFGPEGKNSRVDLYIWCPSQPDFELIVECDGYQFHKSKESFSADRSRDRIFTTAGYSVFRFSGSEIVRDLKKVADELVLSAMVMRYGSDRPELALGRQIKLGKF